ncbi:phosphoglucomutase/phosphomannomutase family protein [Vibrio metschnikovii]|uniref:Phosphoglucomutase/phosphomannomutase family protein n=1 Tax=bacterium 19CA03SA04 TaxID=2920698 RepID=A0AAU6SW57_UNCXX|nr:MULTISPECIES: phosphoglucomutase/phosphomannomutase family protein [Vibrio]EKO3557462.1 phosphoglucomutase/phosphomannomutase family protein [Vibrio metschnikovii]EKO3568752.1 phosphoglucomutase/phosphomannomutase family protein [Vibrio metschnikovii]EKO3585997.1 phosphoglucomutase/phosphomannomutase family protein [Vibrio metschnikovii]EKO3603307.1 phosphoglucomutase/phosphomannomutase family protein [Vibrio metschnikovii]EKO3614588.1 phosphoglucomutase/phosphomannomutase family protein [V
MIQFGTGGWRAFIGEEFTKDNVRIVAQALANIIQQEQVAEQGFVIGYDRRFLSDKAGRWFAEVLAGNGIVVSFINKFVPTPVVMFQAKVMDCAYSACITASHNPADYNGIKVFIRGGRDADEIITKKIEQQTARLTLSDIRSLDFEQAIAEQLIININPMNDFVDSIINLIDIDAIRKANLRVLIDPMFGVAKNALQTVLINGRCDVDVINDGKNPDFGGLMPSPSAATLYRLQHLVKNEGYDIGIGTDGDADRLGIIDEKGHFIHPNEVLMLLYYYLLEYKGWKGSVVRNIATTHLLDKIAADHGEQCFEVPVGFKHISSQMEAADALIGGESSGGLTIRGHIKGKDGVFASSLLVEMLSVTGKKLSELLEEIYGRYGYAYTAEGDCKFSQQQKASLYNKLYVEKQLPDFDDEIEKVSYEDGAKVYFSNGGWIIARFSGTEPLLRIFAEMADKPTAERLVDQMKAFLQL